MDCSGVTYISRGWVSNIEPSLNAAFIDYGFSRQGFLTRQDVNSQAVDGADNDDAGIGDLLTEGQRVVVQVTREAIGNKGAVLTTNVSLPGRYLVLTPYQQRLGVSRKLEDDQIRDELREKAQSLTIPEGCGVILRTNASGQTKTTLRRDLSSLAALWKRVQKEAANRRKPGLVHEDQDLMLRALRDYLDKSIDQIVVDSVDHHDRIESYLRTMMPRSSPKLVRHTGRVPLFAYHGVETQIAAISQRSVTLPSGGSIVIDPTEALTAIDVNSGKNRAADSQEQTALNTNLEAAEAVARQLRLRDIGGLVVVDFIDMRESKHQRQVEKALTAALKHDKARCRITKISSNGLLEINRQRIGKALRSRVQRVCSTCGGTGAVATEEQVGRELLRQLEECAARGGGGRVRARIHPDLVDGVQNRQRARIAALEAEFEISVEIIGDSSHRYGQYRVDREPKTNRSSRNSRANGTNNGGDRQSDSRPKTVQQNAETSPPKKRRRRRRSSRASSSKEESAGETVDAASAKADSETALNADHSVGSARKSGSRRRSSRGRGRRSRSVRSES